MQQLSVSQLLPGDEIRVPGNPRMSSISGTIAKVNRVNVKLKCPYMGGMILDIQVSRNDLIHGKVARGGVLIGEIVRA